MLCYYEHNIKGELSLLMKKIDSRLSYLIAIKEGLFNLLKISLYRNAIYLMLNSAMYALTGFFFWIVAARLYPAEVVGLASSTIAAIGLLSLLSTLGLDYGLLRFLPAAGDEAREIFIPHTFLTSLVQSSSSQAIQLIIQ